MSRENEEGEIMKVIEIQEMERGNWPHVKSTSIQASQG